MELLQRVKYDVFRHEIRERIRRSEKEDERCKYVRSIGDQKVGRTGEADRKNKIAEWKGKESDKNTVEATF